MLARLDDRCCIASSALRVNELNSVDKLTASVALVALGVSVTTALEWASSTDHAICEGRCTCLTILLLNSIFIGIAGILQVVEDVLRNLSLFWCCGTAELVEVAIEPLVDLSMLLMVMITDLLRSLTLLTSLGLSGSAVLVGTTDVNCVVTSQTTEAGVYIT